MSIYILVTLCSWPFTVCPLSELLAVVLMAVVEEEEGREGKERGGKSQGNLVTDKDQGKKIRLLEKLHLSFQC